MLAPILNTENRSPQPSASHASTPARKCSGDGSAGKRQDAVVAATIDHRQLQSALPAHAIGGADAIEKRQRLDVAAHQDVLAVVDALAGCGIGERRGAAAKTRARFEDEHARAGFGQGGGGGKAGASAANHDRVKAIRSHVAIGSRSARAERVKPNADSCDSAQIRSAIRARCIFGTRTRSLNTS